MKRNCTLGLLKPSPKHSFRSAKMSAIRSSPPWPPSTSRWSSSSCSTGESSSRPGIDSGTGWHRRPPCRRNPPRPRSWPRANRPTFPGPSRRSRRWQLPRWTRKIRWDCLEPGATNIKGSKSHFQLFSFTINPLPIPDQGYLVFLSMHLSSKAWQVVRR